MHWVRKEDLAQVPVVNDLDELLRVMLDDRLNEFQCVIDGDEWKVVIR